METKEIITLSVAIFGAFVGSISLLMQVFKFSRDRAILNAQFALSFVSDEKHPDGCNILTINLVNTGQRPIIICEFGIKIVGVKSIRFDGKEYQCLSNSFNIPLYKSEKNQYICLKENEKHSAFFDKFSVDMLEHFSDKMIPGYIIDTTGKIFESMFLVPSFLFNSSHITPIEKFKS